MTKTQQISAVRMIADAVIDSVKVSGSLGVSGGVLYAALMASGCTLSQFEMIMEVLVQSGKLTRKGNFYLAA